MFRPSSVIPQHWASVDWAGLIQLLEGATFDGWLIVETDVTPLPTALERAIVSRKNLRGFGI
jgi:sugar phosphate isomerase/epimerase